MASQIFTLSSGRKISGFPSLFGDRYVVERELGRGGAATVYLAHDQHVDRPAAIKVLRDELAYALGHERFLREIRIASQLRHPHIIPVLDFGETEGRLWYAMPYVEGGSLRQRLERESQLKVDQALRWSAEVASALAYAHRQGIVHRDVKPENILIDGEHALLADFGIARGMDRVTADTLTSAGIAVGTPAYMSPEQASGASDLDGRSDVYSLACVLYECLAGIPPFVGPTPQSVIAQRFAHAPHPIASYRSTVPLPVQDLLADALQIVPADRLDASEVGAVLRGELTEESRVSSRRSGANRAQSSQRTLRKTLIPALAIAVLAVVAIALRVFVLSPKQDQNKVVVFPLTPAGGFDSTVLVSGVPSLISLGLEGVSSLRWVEGEALESSDASGDARTQHADRLRAVRSAGAGYFIDGTFIRSGDSARVVMRLVSAATDSVVARAGSAGLAGPGDAGALALRAVGQLLPQLLEPGKRADLTALTDREPKAIAAFLLGEREFRHSRYAEALAHYQQALAIDSNLAIAAIKAARSARSLFREEDARRFVALALERDSLLPGANAPFARGLSHFYRHNADSAMLELQRAEALAPDWAEVPAAMGDVHFYVGVDGQQADSAASDRYLRARQLDSTFTPALYHLAWLAARRKDTAATRDYVREYRNGESPDTTFVRAATLAADCQSGGEAAVNWSGIARSSITSLVVMGKVLAGSGADLRCSKAAFLAAFEKPGPPTRDHFGAIIGLNAVAMLSSDTTLLMRLAASPMGTALRVRNLLVLDAVGGLEIEGIASVADSMLATRSTLIPEELWIVGAWLATKGRVEDLRIVVNQLRRRVSGLSSVAALPIVESLNARLLLLEGDTALATAKLASSNASASFQEVEWRAYESRAADNTLLARVALARAQYDQTQRFGQRLELAYPITNAVFYRDAVGLSIRAAAAVRNEPLGRQLESRLKQLMRAGQADRVN